MLGVGSDLCRRFRQVVSLRFQALMLGGRLIKLVLELKQQGAKDSFLLKGITYIDVLLGLADNLVYKASSQVFLLLL